MIPLRAAALYTAGLLVAFAAGWFLKPASVPEHTGQDADGASRRIAPPTSLAGRAVGTAGETWLDSAAADAAAVRGAARSKEANQVLLEKLGTVLTMTDSAERLARWQALMPLMRMEDAGAIRAMLQKNRAERRSIIGEIAAFWKRCGRIDPATALAWAGEDGGSAVPDVLHGWAGRDSAAALAWLRARPQPTYSDSGFEPEPEASISGLMNGLAAQSPDAAVKLILASGDDPLFRSCLDMAGRIIVQRDGIEAAWKWFTALAESGAPSPLKSANLEALLACGGISPAQVGASPEMDLAGTVVGYAGETWFSRYAASQLGTYLGEADPAAGAGVLGTIQDAEAKEHFTDSLMREWISKDAGSVGEWLNRNLASPSFDTVAFELAKYLADEDPEAARGWAAQINDPAKKEALKKAISKERETVLDGAAVIQ